ncbi:MAG: hypothetical protein COC01_08705 [Bacteroidetes bacterium]|nr:hypothetical protein [Bacteroidia bacterium]PCH66189.1 MAG: hypothetical protein COC01_08705 [Bacteroidota bacterium]
MKNLKKVSVLAILGVFTLTSMTGCKKYEEGPAVSLKSKKSRVTNEWKIDYAYDLDDAEVITDDFLGETWVFSKDGTFTEKDNGTIDKVGTWEFISDKKIIQISIDGTGSSTDEYTILKLKSKEMWLKDKDEELHLIPAN